MKTQKITFGNDIFDVLEDGTIINKETERVDPFASVPNIQGLKICITGKLRRVRRHYEQAINSAGAEFHTSVKTNTDILVTGRNVGETKMNAAKRRKCQVIGEDTFYDMLRKAGWLSV